MKSSAQRVENTYDESALFEIQRLKSRIVKQISHEFRTPLTSIIGFAEMLEEDVHIDENQRKEYASYIRNEGLRLTKLVDDLIGLDSLEQGLVDFQFEESEIQQTVLDSLKLVAETALNKFIHISLEMPNEPVLLKFDRERIIQALYQLLHNAVRFTRHGGLINLKVETTDECVVISILDSGPGISTRDIPSLFKRFGKFYRPGEETQGSGVGLAIVKHIIDQHNGDIAVQSQVGKGSIFTVRIPNLS
ncbi:MAG: HAMP domain-containing sensor histidine kinase [Bacteroidota bacterium]|jgi:signal transduction histidine kinase